MATAKENLDKDNFSKVENMENIIKSMKHYISNDFDPLDENREESRKFDINAEELMHAVVLLMMQGGWKTAEISGTMETSLGKADKQIAAVREVIGNALEKDQKKWEESQNNISHYTVTFLITYPDYDPEILYSVTDEFDAENLQSLYDLLDEGIQNDEITPEINIEMQPAGDLNIDYVIIRDSDGKELYRDQEFNEKLVPVENRIV